MPKTSAAPSNFDFLRDRWPALHQAAVRAEAAAQADPRAACTHARLVLEGAVRWLYDHDAALPYTARQDSLGALVHEPAFRTLTGPAVHAKTQAVQRVGNLAAHDLRPIGTATAVQAVRELHHVLHWLARQYSDGRVTAGAFDPSLVPSSGGPATSTQERDRIAAEFEAKLAAQIAEHERQTELGQAALAAEQARVAQAVAEQQAAHAEAQAAAAREDAARQDTEAALDLAQEAEARSTAAETALAAAQDQAATTRDQLEALRQQTATARAAVQRQPDTRDLDEASTRRLLIDAALVKADWDPTGPDVAEYVVDKPGKPGVFKVDYVLWDDDGLPLAVVEAKKTSVSAERGKEQARLYADALEARFGRRPVIFYTNGYTTRLWDDAQGAAPRTVLAPYSKEGLRWLVHQRAHRRPLGQAVPDPAVAGRPYQVDAVRATFDRFEAGGRGALLSMATGTGKTRTAVALAKLLVEHGWTKRVLFLCDRLTLVTQALEAFKEHAPDLPAVDLTKGDDPAARVVVSTYPTVANALERPDGPAYGADAFGLVIIDEAHRSVYDRYRVLFDYFDALFLGLTATPRDAVSHDTYGLFGLPTGEPTIEYGLDQAVAEGYLVPARTVEAESKFIAHGIDYDELSDDEKADYEDQLFDPATGEILDHVDAAALNQWLFNEDTVDQAIGLLMERGQHVAGGDRLAKTIVFARNVRHAEFIVERFEQAFGQLGTGFAKAIYAADPRSTDTIADFKDADKAPHVAVSVDMLDTGFDEPKVANLLVFKPVRSRVKWEQMKGRGTRLRPDLFGPDQDKTHFTLIDLCGNVEFFRDEKVTDSPRRSKSLSERLFHARLTLALAADPSAAAPRRPRGTIRAPRADARRAPRPRRGPAPRDAGAAQGHARPAPQAVLRPARLGKPLPERRRRPPAPRRPHPQRAKRRGAGPPARAPSSSRPKPHSSVTTPSRT